ncbi:hypothetical protein GCM10025770_38250 [Viridibacterium curvum]|uniref:ABM domain-containing protein n=1 Tax=Viridibacterium curvum TaxID=1101404 RepID=A0ABP9R6A7_9RHOO
MKGVWVRRNETRNAAILSTGGGRPELIVPELFEPVLTGISRGGFQLRGYERIDQGDGPYLVLQEWQCEELSLRDARYDRDWHPVIEKLLRKRDGVPPSRDPRA